MEERIDTFDSMVEETEGGKSVPGGILGWMDEGVSESEASNRARSANL
jgi:hypothetical protein